MSEMSTRKVQKHLQEVNQAFEKEYLSKVPRGNVVELRRHLKSIAEEFARADANNSGDIDLSEIGACLKALGRDLPPASIKAAIRRVDDDDSGTLRYREFINLILLEKGFISEPIEERSSAPAAGGLGRRRHGAVKKKKRGHLKLSVVLKETRDHIVLEVEVYEAKNLLPADLNGLADPYVKMYVHPDPSKKTKQKTKIVKKTLNPVWNEKFTWKFSKHDDLSSRKLHVAVWDWDRVTRNDFMGAMAFTFKELMDEDTVKSNWFILLDEEQGATFNFPDRCAPPIKKNAAPIAKSSGGSITDYHLLKVLGRGSFGKVFLAERKTDKKLVAIKALHKLRVIEDDDVAATITERTVLGYGRSAPFMIELVCAFQSQSSLFFVMGLVAGGDMMFHAMQQGSFSEKATTFYAAEISCALQYLHDKGIIYRDLKLDNVMLDEEGHVRLADFGLCKLGLSEGERTSTFCGTPNYLAPEIVTYRSYGKEVDWWSLGVIMYEMMNGIVLFDGDSEQELFRNILHQPIEMTRTMSRDARQIVSNFLCRVPSRRLGYGPSAKSDIRAEPFFKDIKWAQLENRETQPPFKPKVKNPRDASNFDSEFTSERAAITPLAKHELDLIDQDLFRGFSLAEEPSIKPVLV
ncbi:AGC/PKC/ALPHA protein kinase [Salpingoeca rosetta]|uniref:AGC/PKC/ALPHA protein kinase n=1 Tax=Salpingoeca rosetta (strain ATCC 50818 / BSB-021) TaxID=946362 RepID=F2UG86_SALR5|nr:AGC/PKC/ALPHA protein kinase [Salpingoeca rosetta]EGD75514.1 AGC/PKC/ALPHA protein kinase [Salpingoeca rosetta]|eukprot:XP_004991971.1 AGC/PKC/ALPHA protein kinase [Salpingoeca rosetta]